MTIIPFLLRVSFIRFRSTDPPASIYTADFTIEGMTGNRTSSHSGSGDEQAPTTDADAPSSSASPSTSDQPNSNDGGKNDLVTVTMEMTGSMISTAPSASAAEQTQSGERGSTVGAVSNDASRPARHIRKANLRFNLVFVLFPALLGLAMAL